MLPETERNDRTATTAVTGVSASQADLSAPLTDRPADPPRAEAQGGEDASRPASAARADDDSSAPKDRDSPAADAREASGATETSASGTSGIEANARSAEAAETDESAEARLETRGDARIDAASRDGETAAGSSTSIEVRNEIVLTANGGADGATPSPASAWSEMNDRLDASRADTGPTGLGAAMDRMADRMDDFRDRIDGMLGRDEEASGADVSNRLDDLRDRAEDFISGSTDDASSALMDEARAQLDGATEDGGGLLRTGTDFLDAARAAVGADDGDAAPTMDDSAFQLGLESIRAEAGNLLDPDAVEFDEAATEQSQGFLAALFDGDLAPSAGDAPSISQFDDLGVDDGELGEMNLPSDLAVTHPGEGFAFDPFDAHA